MTEEESEDGHAEDGVEEVVEKSEETKDESEDDSEKTEIEKTPILEEHRHLFPEKFKTYEAAAAWGSEAEKAKTKAEQERSHVAKQVEEYEDLIGQMESNIEKREQAGTITPEERDRQIAQLHEEFEKDPKSLITQVVNEIISKKEHGNLEKEKVAGFEKEAEKYRKKWGKDTFETEIRPQLADIAAKKPHLQSLTEVVAIYEYEQSQKLKNEEAEDAEKRAEKKNAFSESSGIAKKPGVDILDKISGAKSIEELEKLRHSVK